MKPTVGIIKSSSYIYHLCADFEYIRALKSCGADVRFVKSSEDALKCDGILFTGGSDVTPSFYGETASKKCGKTNYKRDKKEHEIFNAFYETGKPIFGICRGMQFVNVCLGGTVFQDITDIQKEEHKNSAKLFKNFHKVRIDKTSYLYEIFAAEEITVNSTHHQAVKSLGKNVKASAESLDGFTEAIESTSHPFCKGVQWHPEHIIKNARQRELIKVFVEKCKAGL